MQAPPRTLKPSTWLAQRLGVSIKTVERLRTADPAHLPPAISIGSSIRYDEAQVELWLLDRQNASTETSTQRPQGENHVAS